MAVRELSWAGSGLSELFIRWNDNGNPPYRVTSVRVVDKSTQPVTWVAVRESDGQEFPFSFPGGTMNADGTVTPRETIVNIPGGTDVMITEDAVLIGWRTDFAGPSSMGIRLRG